MRRVRIHSWSEVGGGPLHYVQLSAAYMYLACRCCAMCQWYPVVLLPLPSGTSTSIQWYSVQPSATKWYHVGHSYEPFPFLLSPTPSSPLDTASKCPGLTRGANNSFLITGTGHSYRCSCCHVYAYLKINSPTCPLPIREPKS